MKIAIAGTRGIPNNYGGFEQCAEFLSVLLVQKGHQVAVYNSHDHPFQKNSFEGVQIVHIYNPENTIGTTGNFMYDLNCMRHAVKHEFDILLVLGYTTASIFYPYINFGKTILITNMDGLEWKRDKWNFLVKKLARKFEKLGAKHSHYLVADNKKIKAYLDREYGKTSTWIAYGCTRFTDTDDRVLNDFGLLKFGYALLIARMEAENNIAMVLEGYSKSSQEGQLVIIGNLSTSYGKKLVEKYRQDPRIIFTGGIYNLEHLNNLRHFSRYYFHGHSVGGTNPSLLEAMACGSFILAHDNEFNRAVLENDALYFADSDSIKVLLDDAETADKMRSAFIDNNYKKVNEEYNWPRITAKYEQLFLEVRKS